MPNLDAFDETDAHTGRSIPLFQYTPSKFGKHKSGAVTVRREVFHAIGNMADFYAVLGYGEDAKNKGFVGEEFIWERYTRDAAPMSRQCLQSQISVYLNTCCAEFTTVYGGAYEASIGQCALDVIDAGDAHCANCPMHPLTTASCY